MRVFPYLVSLTRQCGRQEKTKHSEVQTPIITFLNHFSKYASIDSQNTYSLQHVYTK